MTESSPARFAPLALDDMHGLQKQVAEQFVRFSARKSISGPAFMLLRSPEVADPILKLSDYLRSGTKVPLKLAELAILIHARLWTDQYEWSIHCRRAIEAGLAATVVADLQAGRRPRGLQPDEAAVFDYCLELSRSRAVSDATFARLRGVLDEAQVVDLTIIFGWYGVLSYLLSVAQVELPDGQAPALPPMQNPFGE